ncbi:MAG: polysaccharide biosynthesis tyrosine autokinase [Oscillochloris sp.]|nr:polysaccharide biosynthesis tyrosine autokinase [Oscillochloris sp.]
MEIRKYIRLLWRWWWVVLAVAGLAGAGAYVVGRRTTPVYEASITLLINQASSNKVNPTYNDLLTSEHMAKTYAELLRTQPVLDAVSAHLGLGMSPADLADQVRVSVIQNTLLILVSVDDTDPQRAADIANEIATVFWRQSRELQVSRYAALKETVQTSLTAEQEAINAIQTDLNALARDVLRAELSQLSSAVDDTRTSLGSADISPQALQAQLGEIQSQIDRIPSERNMIDILGTDDQIARQSELRTGLQQHQSNYDSLLRSLEEVRMAETQTGDYLSIAEHAAVPTDPIRPRIALNMLMSAILGALAALGLAFAVEFFDNSVRTRDDIEQLAGVPALAAITRIRGIGLGSKLVTARSSGSPSAEAYRMLRTNIEFAEVDRAIRTLVVTSCAPGEGKSTTTANLAVTLAQTGRRVLLVDLDLRGPVLHQIFKVQNQRGITTVLLHPSESIDAYMLPTGVENLSIIPSGPLPSNPAELLGSQRMADLIEQLKGHADLILFDCSPMLLLADATLLARRCDAALLVARAGSTQAGSLVRARDQMAQAGVRLLGVVLNRVATTLGSDRYYYRQRFWRGLRPLPLNLKRFLHRGK